MTAAPTEFTADAITELDLTSDALVETQHLQKNFGRREILLFTICTLVGVDTIGLLASLGAEAFTWNIVLAITFFIPSALLFAELGTAFPQEGGPYICARLAFGRLAATINNVLYWVTNPVWFGGTLSIVAVATVSVFFLGGNEMNTFWFYVFTMAFVWIGTLAAILSFRVGKYIPIAGAYARFILLGFFTLSTIIFAFKNGVHGVGLSDFGATKAGLFALAGVIMFGYVGFELPSAAGEEMKDPKKDVPFSIFRSAIVAILMYSIPVLCVIIVLPADQVSGLGGFIDAMRSVFTVYGGSVDADGIATLTGLGTLLGALSAILFILCLLSSGVAWIMGSDRALAVSGYDGAAPRYLCAISAKYGTPVRVNVLSGILGSLVVIAVHELSGGDSAKYFLVILSIAVSTTLISYIAIFPALWRLRVTHPDHPRPFRAPWAPFLSVLLTAWVIFATVQLLLPGFGDDWFGDAYLPDGWAADERVSYFLVEAIPLLIFILVGVAFYFAGSRTRHHRASEVGAEAVEEIAAEEIAAEEIVHHPDAS
ncbi:MAG: APC family permease [Actinobacteria bacterium]|nr:APC family permease [Actinomycetota bacterium]